MKKYKFETLKSRLSKIYLISYIILYVIILSFGIPSAIRIKSLPYSIALIILLLVITIIPVIALFLLNKLLSPLNQIDDYIKGLSQFRYYKKKEYTDIQEYRSILDSIFSLSELLEETKLNYERYKLRINNLNSKKEMIELQEKDLIYSISHELKTPISIIEAGTYAILDAVYEGEDEKKELETIVKQCELSISMIQDVLNVFKLSRSDFKLNNEPLNLKDLVTEKLESFNDLFKKYNQNLILNLTDSTIICDKTQMNTVLSNVIQNAITNSPNGSDITINIKKTGKETIFEIINSNVVIPEEKLTHIFEPFVKVDESHTKKEYKGNGLGLYITKQILSKFNYDFGILNLDNAVKFYFIAK